MLLTRTLGHKSLAECRKHISSQEFALWLAEYHMEPWGDLRLELIIANALAVISRMFGNKNATLKDYMLRYNNQPDQTTEDMINAVKNWIGGFKNA